MAREVENEAGSGLIAWISAGLNVTNVFMRAAGTLGKELSPIVVKAGGHLGNAATLGAVAYEVYQEDGIEHRGERAGAGVAAAGVNIALGTAAASVGETAALTGVAGATGATVIAAAAPIVLAGVAAGVTAKAADLAIETHRTYEALDRSLAEQAAPQRIRQRAKGEKPSFFDYRHLVGMREVTAGMRDEALHADRPIERFPGSGIIKNIKALDMTQPENLAEYERALNTEIARQTAVMSANDSLLPRWLRGGDSVDRYNEADIALQNLKGAKAEVAMFRADLRRYEEQITNAPITSQSASMAARDRGMKTTHAFEAAASNLPAKTDTPRQAVGAHEPRSPTAKPLAPG